MTDYPELDDILHRFFTRYPAVGMVAVEEATQSIRALMIRERVDELKKFKAIFATSLDVETYDALAKRIKQLSASSKGKGES